MDSIYKPGEEVELLILRETDLGFVAKINEGPQEGLLYHDEIFKHLSIDQTITGYVKKIRHDSSIDLILQNVGHLGSEELGLKILEILKKHQNFIPVNAKSPAEDIYNLFGVSRKKFKMALGTLYKKRLIDFTDSGTRLLKTL